MATEEPSSPQPPLSEEAISAIAQGLIELAEIRKDNPTKPLDLLEQLKDRHAPSACIANVKRLIDALDREEGAQKKVKRIVEAAYDKQHQEEDDDNSEEEEDEEEPEDEPDNDEDDSSEEEEEEDDEEEE
jgi:hypothetical protein